MAAFMIFFRDDEDFYHSVECHTLKTARDVWDRLSAGGYYMRSARP